MKEQILQSVFEMSPYDDTLPLKLLQGAFEVQTEEAAELTQRVYCDVLKNYDVSAPVLKPGEEKIRLVMEMSDGTMQDYQDGVLKLAQEKGHMVAQLKSNNRYGKKLPIKEEKYLDGPDSLSVQNALKLQAILDALIMIAGQIQAIDVQVKEVLSGQQNDRLALYYSGVALFLEANSIQDQLLRKELICQALKTLTDSTFQLMLQMKSDIDYLQSKKYDEDKKNKFNLLKEKMLSIEQSFMAIHQASIMKAGIYCTQGEIRAFAGVLCEYERFIKGTIVRNAEMLSQCDLRNDGIWKKRANLELDTAQVVRKLQEPKSVLYIESKGEGKNESN